MMWSAATAVVACLVALAAGGACAPDLRADLEGTELLYTFVTFRHGDRTPEAVEAASYPSGPQDLSYYPYGYGQLTNVGKRRAYSVGEYLRSLYGSFLDAEYLPSQITINSTNLDRTKMTGLAVLAAMYPPTQLQRFKAELPWQPIPYSVQNIPSDACSTSYYQKLYAVLLSDDFLATLAVYSDLYEALTEYSGAEVTQPMNVLLLQGVIQGNANYGIAPPAWYEELLPEIEKQVALQFQLFYNDDELIRLYSGELLNSFLETSASIIAGAEASPRVRFLSAHDTTVAAMMSAARVFTPHRPQYGATFSLELRRNITGGEYYVAPVYKVGGDAGEVEGAAQVLRVPGCGDGALCDFAAFVQLTENVALAAADVAAACSS